VRAIEGKQVLYQSVSLGHSYRGL